MMNYVDLQNRHPELFDNSAGRLPIITDPAEIHKWQDQRRTELAKAGQPLAWADIGIVFQDRYITYVSDLVDFGSNFHNNYPRILNTADLSGGQGVVGFPMYQNQVLLLHHFRHATRQFHYEVPRGFGEPGTPAEAQIRNEIEEETHSQVKRVVDLGPYHNNTGMESTVAELFFCEVEQIGEPEKSEGIEAFELVDLDRFEAMVRDAEITDGFTIAAYTRAKLRGLLG